MNDLHILPADGFLQHLMEQIAVIGEQLSKFADKIHINEVILFAVGAALAVLIGMFGYRLSKFFMGVAFAAGGYLGGTKLFEFFNDTLAEKWNLKFELTDWTVYLLGGICALILLLIGMRFPKFAMWAVGVTLAFWILNYFLYDWGFVYNKEAFSDYKVWILLGGSFVAGILFSIFFRIAMVIGTSAGAAFVCLELVSESLPETTVLQYTETDTALFGAMALAVIFALVQFLCGKGIKAWKKKKY